VTDNDKTSININDSFEDKVAAIDKQWLELRELSADKEIHLVSTL